MKRGKILFLDGTLGRSTTHVYKEKKIKRKNPDLVKFYQEFVRYRKDTEVPYCIFEIFRKNMVYRLRVLGNGMTRGRTECRT